MTTLDLYTLHFQDKTHRDISTRTLGGVIEVIKDALSYGDRVVRVESGSKDVSKIIAIQYFEDWLKDGNRPDDNPIPGFIENHLTNDLMEEIIADLRTWDENPA